MKLKYPHLPKTLGTKIQENYWFRMLHFEMRYPVLRTYKYKKKNHKEACTQSPVKLDLRLLQYRLQNPGSTYFYSCQLTLKARLHLFAHLLSFTQGQIILNFFCFTFGKISRTMSGMNKVLRLGRISDLAKSLAF